MKTYLYFIVGFVITLAIGVQIVLILRKHANKDQASQMLGLDLKPGTVELFMWILEWQNFKVKDIHHSTDRKPDERAKVPTEYFCISLKCFRHDFYALLIISKVWAKFRWSIQILRFSTCGLLLLQETLNNQSRPGPGLNLRGRFSHSGDKS